MSKFLETNSYVALRTSKRDRWWSIPRAYGTLSVGDPRNGSVFYLEKLDGSPGPRVYSRDYVRIRGIDGDPWLKAIANENRVLGSHSFSTDHDAVFYVEKLGGSPGQEIRIKDSFRIRGTKSDPWLYFKGFADGPLALAQNLAAIPPDEAEATTFIVELVETLHEFARYQEVIEGAQQVDARRIQLGWTTIWPCSRLEWTNDGILGTPSATLRVVEQRIYLFALFDEVLLREVVDDVRYAAAVAAAAAGIAALISGGSAALSTFQSVFEAALAERNVPESLSRVVSFQTETRCMWP